MNVFEPTIHYTRNDALSLIASELKTTDMKALLSFGKREAASGDTWFDVEIVFEDGDVLNDGIRANSWRGALAAAIWNWGLTVTEVELLGSDDSPATLMVLG